MKKLLFSAAAIIATSFASGQITLEHSFAPEQQVILYSDATTLKYVTLNGTQIIIYNSDYSVFKTFPITIPSIFSEARLSTFDDFPFNVSKYVFNTDDKLEFFVFFNGTWPTKNVMIFDEDGNIVKNFNDNYTYELVDIFHDSTTNTNKLKMGKYSAGTGDVSFDIYSLPTSSLTTKEIKTKNKLSAFPIPTNKILNILNPQNGANKIEIFDTSGKIVLNKSFGNSENKISVDVENLPKGIYIYKVGDLNSKFIKN